MKQKGDTRRKVRMKSMAHGDSALGRDRLIYCVVEDAETGELLLSATLGYVIQVVEDRDWRFVK
ncbi:hypothetical protein [Microcystis phage Mwe-JY26]